eukprot:TRINITY_DN164_c1_g1_i1.p1 TRINITY_DN164_c1_g1~~TRINITY_DN164_c1_g1_i1.p1  ORF type:complete len:119 (-),score=13.62 TRINITY_DN164_c1_g1_i1:58-414(-)
MKKYGICPEYFIIRYSGESWCETVPDPIKTETWQDSADLPLLKFLKTMKCPPTITAWQHSTNQASKTRTNVAVTCNVAAGAITLTKAAGACTAGKHRHVYIELKYPISDLKDPTKKKK